MSQTSVPRPSPVFQKVMRVVLGLYLKVFHRMTADLVPELPASGPFVALTTHFSILDAPVLMVVDPYRPFTTLVVKTEMMQNSIGGTLLRWWGAISVARSGEDMAAVRQILTILNAGRGVCIAPQGT